MNSKWKHPILWKEADAKSANTGNSIPAPLQGATTAVGRQHYEAAIRNLLTARDGVAQLV